MIPIIRRILRMAVVSSAIVWLALNAIHLLEHNFELPFGLAWWHAWLIDHPRVHAVYAWLADRAWPWLLLVLVVVLRQEAHRWFRIRRGRRSADRLLIAWFVFIGTVALLDWLTPGISVAWPATVIETSIWLLTFCMAAWISRVVHPATRRKLESLLKRWHLIAAFERLLKRGVSRDEHPIARKGGRSNALPKRKRSAG